MHLSHWEERSKAFLLGVHLILFYFIRISLSIPKIFVLFCWCGCGCGCGWWTFFVFKSLDNNMYSLCIDVFTSEGLLKVGRQKSRKEGGGWYPTFLLFKSLDNNMVYSLGIDVYVCNRNSCTTKVLWVLKF